MVHNLRIQYPRANCHVLNREDRSETIFGDDQDRERLRMGT